MDTRRQQQTVDSDWRTKYGNVGRTMPRRSATECLHGKHDGNFSFNELCDKYLPGILSKRLKILIILR